MPVLTLPGSDALALTVRAKALVFEDPASRELLARIEQIAPSDATALIIGETGTGKEIVARHLHDLSARRGRPFVAVNCGAFSETLVESELFGHERGAFTGAVGSKKGWFETADGGTLFLDEIGDLSPAVQVKLLRVLQEREVVRLGARQPIPIDVRLVAATNVDLGAAVRAGHFREDLFYRLNVAGITLPPLRQRPGDILPLARYFMGVYGQRLGARQLSLDEDAAARLVAHAWPGNIRELENVVHQALLVCRDGRITAESLRLAVPVLPERSPPARPAAPAGGPTLDAALLSLFESGGGDLYARIEATVMRAAFAFCHRNQVQTARLLGISRNIVRARLQALGEIAGNARDRTPGPEVRPSQPLVRAGHQQFGLLALLRASGALERALAPLDARVSWTEFQSGLELTEALRAGALDVGVTGEGPPVVAQADNVPIVYLGAEPPSPSSEAIVVRRTSPIATVAGLRGARIAVTRGANAHLLVLRALEEVGVAAGDVDLVFAPPRDGSLLFERGQVDAWAIWDPWLAEIERRGARVLRDAVGLSSNRAYYVAARPFAQRHPRLVDAFLSEVRALGRAATDNPEMVSGLLGAAAGIDPEVLRFALQRGRYGVQAFDDELVASQQRVADSSLRDRLIARPVSVASAVRPAGSA